MITKKQRLNLEKNIRNMEISDSVRIPGATALNFTRQATMADIIYVSEIATILLIARDRKAIWIDE